MAAAVVASALVAACGAAGSGPGRTAVDVTGGAAPGAPPSPPSACPGPTSPPGARYTLAVHGTITGTLRVAHNANNPYPSIVPRISASFCGSLDVATETGIVPPSGIRFAPAVMYVGYHKGTKGKVSFVQEYHLRFKPVGDAVAAVVRTGPAADGGLELTLSSEVDTTVSIGPARCLDGPVHLRLSSEVRGGAAVTGPLQAASGTVAEAGFTIPAVPDNEPACVFGIPYGPTINALLELPAKDTQTSETIGLHVSG